MQDVEVEFIERFGLMFEEDGLPRIAGRIFGLLLLREGPLMLDDLAEMLQVSKGSVSTNTRLLDRMAMIERAGKPGDRRAFYRLAPNAIVTHLDRLKSRMGDIVDLLDSTTPAVTQKGSVVEQRLELMRDWHVFLLDELDDLMIRWKKRREALESGQGDEEDKS